jgi:glycopeptide antibiotics resistance protein
MLEGSPLPVIGLPLLLVVAVLRVNAGVHWRRAALEVALAEYALFVAGMILFPMVVQPELRAHNGSLLANPAWWVNAVPLKTIGELVARTSPDQAIRQIGGNLGLLVPLGFLLPAISQRLRGWRAFTLAAVSLSVGLEAAQFAERAAGLAARSVDIDDVVLNALGALLGYVVYRASVAFLSRPDEASTQPPVMSPTVRAADRLPCPRVPRTTYAWWTTP